MLSQFQSQQRRKKRPIRSCLSCRQRRIKCDQLNPICSNCERANRACVYGSLSEDTGQASQGQNQGADSPGDEEGTAVSNRNQGAEDIGYLHRMVGGRTPYVSASFWGISNKDGPELSNFLEDRVGRGPDFFCLCASCTGLRQLEDVELPSLRILRNEVSVYNKLHSLGQIVEQVPSREICDRLWATFISSVYPLIPVLHLPTFYRQYNDFWRSVDECSRGGSPGGFLAECPSFLPLLLSTLFCGSSQSYHASSRDDDPHDRLRKETQQSGKLYRLAMQSLTMLGFPRDPTIYGLAAFVILHLPLIREESDSSTAFISTAFRVGQALGLHRDPKHFDIPLVEAKLRCRIWWHILHKDTLSSADTGLPQMIWNRRNHDTAMISEGQDRDSDNIQSPSTEALTRPHGKSRTLSSQSSLPLTPLGVVDFRSLEVDSDCRQVVSVGRFLVTNVLSDILGRQTDLEPWSIQEVQRFQNSIERMSIQVKGRVDRLQAAENMAGPEPPLATPSNTSEEVTSLHKASIESWTLARTEYNRVFLAWSQRLLGLMLEKAYCTLYQPLPKCADKTLWAHFREIAVSHFHAYIEQYVAMCTEPSYAPFQWLYPGNYQPLQAITLLLVDLIERPTSIEAPTSRHLVDRVFSLLDHEQGVVVERNGHRQRRRLSGSGRESWVMLLRLRRRAWTGMRLDPNVLWASAQTQDDAFDSSSDEGSADGNEATEGDHPAGEGRGFGLERSSLIPTTSPTDPEPLAAFTDDAYFMDLDQEFSTGDLLSENAVRDEHFN